MEETVLSGLGLEGGFQIQRRYPGRRLEHRENRAFQGGGGSSLWGRLPLYREMKFMGLTVQDGGEAEVPSFHFAEYKRSGPFSQTVRRTVGCGNRWKSNPERPERTKGMTTMQRNEDFR